MTPMRVRSLRVLPGTRRDIGLLNAAIARGLGKLVKSGPPNIFTTLGRHRSLFRRWLVFAGGLMPNGKLPRKDTELLILRVASLCECVYEWEHHVRIGRLAGLTPEQIAGARAVAPEAPLWSPRQSALLRAADELHAQRVIGDHAWAALVEHLQPPQIIELCFLVGHYEMLAMTLNSLGVQPDT